MNPLENKRIPAYGFESSTIHATYAARFRPAARLAIMAKGSNTAIKVNNLIKILGYIPIIGIAAGIFRLVLVIKDKTGIYSKWHIPRSITEILGIGFINAPVDLALTLRRRHQFAHAAEA
jgi:hypothetical protein